MVTAVLVWWHFVGANTSDDGYILTMARVSEHAGYMANYYRWFGTPEAPFGWYYDLLALWAHVSTASVWVRLPTLLMALACWWVISREVIPRLGHAVKISRAAAWTAAGMFLAFWLPLNNGLRPEPIIALGILLTWCSVERGVATSRLLPVAIAIIIGALTLFSGPTGIAAVGALLVAIGPLKTIVAAHTSRFGYLRAAGADPGRGHRHHHPDLPRPDPHRRDCRPARSSPRSAPAWPGSTSTSATSGCSWPAPTARWRAASRC